MYMRSLFACGPPQAGKRWMKVLGSFIGAAVLALGINASTLASPDDEFITQEDLKALKEEIKILRDEIKSTRVAKPQLAPPITGNVYSGLARRITVGGEVRARFESFYNFDLSGSPNDSIGESGHNEITLLRTRLHFDADINDYLRAYLELQDNRAFGDEDEFHANQGRNTGTNPALNPRGTTGNLGRVDLLEGYLELRSLAFVSDVLSNISIKIGRWQMSYGGERVISEYDWSNQGRAWDGIKVRWSGKKQGWGWEKRDWWSTVTRARESYDWYPDEYNWIDVFVTQIDEDFFDQRGGDRDEIFWGIYAHYAALEGHEIEPYFLATNQSADMGEKKFRSNFSFLETSIIRENRYIAGLRLAGEPPEVPNFDYELEGLFQFGNVKLENIRAPGFVVVEDIDIEEAYAFYANAGYTFDVLWKPRVGGGFSYASGDDSIVGREEVRSPFVSQASGVNLGLGYAELVGWQNIIDYRVILSAEPTTKWHLRAGFHFLYLAEEEDFWFDANGNAIARWNQLEGTNTPDNQLARELDLIADYALFRNFHLTLGYSHFFQGNFIEDDNVISIGALKPFGGSDLDWFFVMTTLRF